LRLVLKIFGLSAAKSCVADRSSNRSAPTRLAWQGECCIDAIQERKSELARASSSHTDVELDLSALSRIDGAGVQPLAAFVLELGQRGHVVHWRGVSNIVIEGARVTGFGTLLGLPPAAANAERMGG
jgi:anti-anti-sigma regulatory factor